MLAVSVSPDLSQSIACLAASPSALFPGTIAIVGCEIFDKYLRTSAKSWAQSELFVREVIERNLPHVPYKIEFSDRTKRISGRVVRAATIVAGSRQV